MKEFNTTSTAAYVSLGSNVEDAEDRLAAARKGLAGLFGVCIERTSSIYLTEPQGYREQPWFTNQVLSLKVEANRHPKQFLLEMLQLEKALGRTRSADPHLRFGPRVIDMDLLLFGDIISQDPVCTLPHPRMSSRAFVLLPLAQIAPGVLLKGQPVEVCLQRLSYRLEGRRIFQ